MPRMRHSRTGPDARACRERQACGLCNLIKRDEAWFRREVVPKLDAFSLKEIGKATGLSLAACSRIRAGVKVPHPRHWETLRKLAGS
jgi:hypothetical protein